MKRFIKKPLSVMLCIAVILGTLPFTIVNAATVGTVEIIGPSRITDYDANSSNTYKYTAVVYDTSGEIITGQSVILSLSGAPSGVSLSEDTITVSEGTAFSGDVMFTVTATSGGVTGEKKVVALDYETYSRDESRLNTAIEFINKALCEGADKEGTKTPLLADSINVQTGDQGKWRLADSSKKFVGTLTLSNLSSQGELMKSMDILSELTGIDRYEEKVNAIYNYYIQNYISNLNANDASTTLEQYLNRNNKNTMVFWGGHMAIDLASDTKTNTYPDNNTHEYKNHMPYMTPFFSINSTTAGNIVKSSWISHITDFSTLVFNRHAKYNNSFTNYNSWTNTGAFTELDPNVKGADALIENTSVIPFRSTANDLIYTACKLYEETGDTNALTWAKRLSDRYVAIRNPETNLGGIQFTTADTPEAKQALANLEESIGKKWYEEADANGKLTELGVTYTYTAYGDRAQNQFADEMIENGFFTEDERDEIQEAYVLWGGMNTNYGTGALVDIMLADAFEKKDGNTSTKNEILKNSAVGMAAYADYAYIPEKNQFKALWANGTDMTGYVAKRSGYYGSKGTVFKATEATADFLLSYSKMYLETQNVAGIESERAKIWNLAKGIAKANNLGTFGSTPADVSGLNMNTDANDPIIVYALVNLYTETGISKYLDLARKVADNMVEFYYNDGYLVDPANKYARLSNTYIYALVILDAAIQGNYGLINDMTLSHPFYSANYIDEKGVFTEKAYDNVILRPAKATPDGFIDIDNETANYDRSYENKSISDTSGWRASAGSEAIVSRIPEMADKNGVSFEAADKAVKMTVKTSDTSAVVTKDILDENENNVTVSGNAKISAKLLGDGSDFTVSLLDTSENAVATANISSSMYTANQWFTLNFTFNSDNNTYTAKINDTAVATDTAIGTGNISIAELQFDLADTEGATLYADNITVSSDAKPTPRLNVPFILISNEKADRVTKDLTLVSSYTDESGMTHTITWESSDESIISNTGKVYRDNTEDKKVVLNAHLADSDGKKTLMSFPIVVTRYGLLGVSENFDSAETENQEITAFDSTWTLYSTNKPVTMDSTIVKAPGDDEKTFAEADKVLRINRTAIDNNSNHRPKKEFDRPLSGELVVKSRIYAESASRYAMKLRDANRKDIAELYFDENGNMANALSKGTQNGTYVANALKTGRWIDVMLHINTNTKKYDVYFDGEKLNPKPYDFYYYDNSTTYNAAGYGEAVAYVEYDIKRQRSSGTLYVDDIEAREISNTIFDIGGLDYKEGSIVTSENFTSKTLGDDIAKADSSWTIYNKNILPTSKDELKSQIANDPSDSKNKVLKIERTSTSGTNHRVKKQFNKAITGKFAVDFRMRADLESKYTVSLKHGFYPEATTLTLGSNGAMSNTGGGASVSNVLTVGQWMHVSLQVDLQQKVYDVYINGNKVNTASYPFRNSDAAQIEYIEFDIDRYTSTGLLYIDDIEVREMDGARTISYIKDVSKLRRHDKDSLIYVAVYDDRNQLYGCRSIDLPADMTIDEYKSYPVGLTIPAGATGYSIKSFVWNKNSLSPLSIFSNN